jgi:hypothetical protein
MALPFTGVVSPAGRIGSLAPPMVRRMRAPERATGATDDGTNNGTDGSRLGILLAAVIVCASGGTGNLAYY